MSKRKKILGVTAIVLVIIACVIIFFPNKKKSYNDTNSAKLYEKIYNAFFTLGKSDLENTDKIKQNIHSIINNSNEGSINFEITELPNNKALEHFGITASYQSDKKNKAASAIFNTDYKDIRLLSGKVMLKDTILKLAVPSLYKGTIKLDTDGLSDRLNNSLLGVFVKEYIDISKFDNINYNSLFNENLSKMFEDIDYNKLTSVLVSEFTQCYEDDAKVIRNNIYTVMEENGDFTFVIKAKAMKTLVKDIGTFIFDGKTPSAILDFYIEQNYKANKEIAKYYDLSEYKKTYRNNLSDSITEATMVISDLINFDVNILIELDEQGRIYKISYCDGNESLKLDLCVDLTYTKNSCDLTGRIKLTLASDAYEFNFSKSHEVLSEASEKISLYFDTMGNSNELSLTYDYKDISKKNVKLDTLIDFSQNNKTVASAKMTADIQKLSYDILEMSGDELDVMNMSFKKLKALVEEIQKNLESLKRKLQWKIST